jgi:hypothetical protein
MSGSESSSPIPQRSRHQNDRRSVVDREHQRDQARRRQIEADSDSDGYDYKRAIDVRSISDTEIAPPLTKHSSTIASTSATNVSNGNKQTVDKALPDSGSDNDSGNDSGKDSGKDSGSGSGSGRGRGRGRGIDTSQNHRHSSQSDSSQDDSSDDSDVERKRREARKKRAQRNPRHVQAIVSTQMPSDGQGGVDVQKLVNTSSGTGLLAGGALPINLDDDDNKSDSDSDGTVSCNICTYALRNVVKLKCGHKYCYSCIKGHLLSHQRNCPFCQDLIAPKFIRTILTEPDKVCKKTEKVDETAQHYWIYNARSANGWWNYDNKSASFLERDYQNWLSNPNRARTNSNYTLMVCGTVMEIDFNNMLQINPSNGAHRKINRVTASELRDLQNQGLLKGIGGIGIRN